MLELFFFWSEVFFERSEEKWKGMVVLKMRTDEGNRAVQSMTGGTSVLEHIDVSHHAEATLDILQSAIQWIGAAVSISRVS